MSLAERILPRALAVGIVLVVAVGLASPVRGTTLLSVQRVANGLVRPVFVASPAGDSRIFIVEQRGADQRGRIKILKNGSILPTPFLTTAPLPTGNEQGLLGLAFPPDFATSKTFYINYTSGGVTGDTRIARHHVSIANPDVADSVGEVFLTVPQPYSNHNAGGLGFGPDGYLWIPLGDGGDAGDPQDRAQNKNVLLGKILRLDVSDPTGYKIPPDNPFVGAAGLDEIWAIGLRNPFRWSFDRLTHDLIIGDVGQLLWEEVDFAPYPALGRDANFGWRCWEGNHSYAASANTPCTLCAPMSCFAFPAHEYDHSSGRCSITGGYVYRGCAIPDLRGTYIFGDYCGGQIYFGRFVGGALASAVDHNAELVAGTAFIINSVSSFGEDAQGELYICDLGGQVYKIIPRTFVDEADLPKIQVITANGDSLGATGSGNALMPGIVAYADQGSRIAGADFLRAARLRACETLAGNCLTMPLRLGTWDIDVSTCVDADSSELTRQFVFTNRNASAQPLVFRDVIAPYLEGTDDYAATIAPAGPDSSAHLLLYDATAPTRFVRHRAYATGATITQDVGEKVDVENSVAADQALAGGEAAGPERLALALSFDFGSVAPAAAETVVVVTRITPTVPVAVDPPSVAGGRLLRAAGAMPFREALAFVLDLPADGDVGLAVYDSRGRRLRVLHAGAMTAGRHTLAWDGRDDRGAPAPAGLYFLRATTAGGEESLRAVRVR
jgi:glucose/arabinose dehydrogenase